MAPEFRHRRLKTETAAAGKFAVIGVLATLTHAIVAGSLLQSGMLPAYPANVCGFLVAFCVSFTGHYFWSFSHLRRKGTAIRSMVRFLVIAVSGFLLNTTVLALWLTLTPGRISSASCFPSRSCQPFPLPEPGSGPSRIIQPRPDP